MNEFPDVSAVLATCARLYPDKVGTADSVRSLTFRLWDQRASGLAHGLFGLGLEPGDRVAVLAHNCVEWMEVYVAVARAGLIAVPVNFRLAAPEVQHIVNDSGARAFLVDAPFRGLVDGIRSSLGIAEGAFIALRAAGTIAGWTDYEELILSARSGATFGRSDVDTWTLMYTSGTTGRPKGAIRSHRSYANFYLLNAAEFGFQRHDRALLVMPMCHVNSVFYSFVFTLMGGTAIVYDQPHFDPEHLLRVLGEQRITFTSLVPTHCTMMLDLPAGTRASVDTSVLRKLLVSSAPARRETKLAVMEQFPNTELYEGYGSTEAGLVTLLRPDEQFDHLGSIGREIIGSGRIRLLDDTGDEVPDGEVGELWSCTPTTFDGYWNLTDKTASAFRDGYCSVGDMARRDAGGYYQLVDRKNNMIISGGENVYPSEVEAALASHPAVRDAAVIGLPDTRWGEQVTAVVTFRPGVTATPDELIDHVRPQIAGYKRPRRVVVIDDTDMPRTPTGKILHRVLRERFSDCDNAASVPAHTTNQGETP